jgi:hypothetical protein
MGQHLDAQFFLPAARDVDGFELATLDTLATTLAVRRRGRGSPRAWAGTRRRPRRSPELDEVQVAKLRGEGVI